MSDADKPLPIYEMNYSIGEAVDLSMDSAAFARILASNRPAAIVSLKTKLTLKRPLGIKEVFFKGCSFLVSDEGLILFSAQGAYFNKITKYIAQIALAEKSMRIVIRDESRRVVHTEIVSYEALASYSITARQLIERNGFDMRSPFLAGKRGEFRQIAYDEFSSTKYSKEAKTRLDTASGEDAFSSDEKLFRRQAYDLLEKFNNGEITSEEYDKRLSNLKTERKTMEDLTASFIPSALKSKLDAEGFRITKKADLEREDIERKIGYSRLEVGTPFDPEWSKSETSKRLTPFSSTPSRRPIPPTDLSDVAPKITTASRDGITEVSQEVILFFNNSSLSACEKAFKLMLSGSPVLRSLIAIEAKKKDESNVVISETPIDPTSEIDAILIEEGLVKDETHETEAKGIGEWGS